MLIIIQINTVIIRAVLKKKLFLRHNFENEEHGKEKSSRRR